MSILEQIETIVKDMTDNNNPPQIVQVSKAYNNNKCDIVTSTGALRNIDCSGTATAGDKALLVYNEGDAGKPFVLLFNGGGGGGDLSDYVKKTDLINKNKYDIDLNLSFGLKGQDDTIVIDMDIVDHVVNKEIDLRGV